MTNLYTGTYRNVLMSVMGENTHGEPLGGGHTHTKTAPLHLLCTWYCTVPKVNTILALPGNVYANDLCVDEKKNYIITLSPGRDTS